jgi:hypothetical protein
MVVQLERAYNALKETTELLAVIRDATREEREYGGWSDLINLEKKRSEFLTEQAVIQEEIIKLLIDGDRSKSQLRELISAAENINQSLSVTDAQIDTLRVTLLE